MKNEEKHCKWYNDEFCTNGDSPCVADYCPVVEYPELCKCRELDKDINVRSKDDTEIDVSMIIKALECCKQKGGKDTCKYCYTCPASVWDFEDGITECNVDLFQKTINLIHRLQREVDKQRNFIVAWEESWKISNEQNTKIRVKLKKENAKLQKQVDELKERANGHLLTSLYKKQADDHKRAISVQRSQCEKKVKQAVKDTAQEIYSLMVGEYECYIPTEIAKEIVLRYGVEVE